MKIILIIIITTKLIFPCLAALMLGCLTSCANDQSHTSSTTPPAATISSDQVKKEAAQNALLRLNTG